MAAGRRPSERRAARELAALGNPTRLRVFKLLVKAGPDGLNVGDLQSVTGVPASTLAHHLSTLAQARLVLQERRGREVISTANFQAMHALVAYLTDQCCEGVHLESEEDAA
jgi:DNA-binding transcriptional ArsR family regulator